MIDDSHRKHDRATCTLNHGIQVCYDCERELAAELGLHVGQTVTIKNPYSPLPGTTLRGKITAKSTGAAWELAVFVPYAGRTVSVPFVPSQIVSDDTPLTDLSLSAKTAFESTLGAAKAAHNRAAGR